MSRRHFLAGTAIAGAAALAATDSRAQGAAPVLGAAAAAGAGDETTVFVNATVLPVDEAFSVAQALAIRGNKIVAVGSEADARAAAGGGSRVIDVGGKTILPGFIEPHMHFFPIALFGPWEDVGPFRIATVDGVVDRLAEVARTKAEGEWIVARQFDPSLQEGPGYLTTEMLDRVSTTNPVLVLNASLHFGYCNSVALRMAGITRETPDPPGAEFGRYADGSPNGVLKGGATMGQVMLLVDGLADPDLLASGLAVCAKANRVGVTTFCDQATGAFAGKGEIDAYHAIAASGKMSTRMRYSVFDGMEAAWDESGIAFGDGDALVRATGWKIVTDGSNQGLTGHQREPYLNSEDTGLPYVDPEALKEKVERRAREGWQVVMHGNGDKAIDGILDAVEYARDAGAPIDNRIRIEHCSILHDEQIARIRDLGISPSFLIGHVYYWGQAFRDEIFGPEKAVLLDRTAACEAEGIRWTLHSDETVTEMGPMRCIHNAVTRQMWRDPDNVLAPEERVPVETAIRSMTRDAAWQCHSEHEIGSLEPGKFADLVVLDQDPRTVNPVDLKDVAVAETWMDGKRVYAA